MAQRETKNSYSNDPIFRRSKNESHVVVSSGTGGSGVGGSNKEHELSPNDMFWSEQKGNPFPTVAESIQQSLEDYKASEGEITALKVSETLRSNKYTIKIYGLNLKSNICLVQLIASGFIYS